MTTAIVKQHRRKEKLHDGVSDIAFIVARITTHVGRLAVSTLVGSFDLVADVLTSPARYAVVNSLNWWPQPCLTFTEAEDYLDSLLIAVPAGTSVRINYCGLTEYEEHDLDAALPTYRQAITTRRFTQETFDELEAIVRRALATVTDNEDRMTNRRCR